LRRAIKRSTTNNRALHDVEKVLFASNPYIKAVVSTTQAIDLIGGGVKSNALPELSWAVVNNRIGTESSVGAVRERFRDLIAPLAADANLTLTAFGKKVLNRTVEPWAAAGDVILSDAWGTALEPAPITPTDQKAVPYKLLSGTILAVENAVGQGVGKAPKVFVAPSVMSGGSSDVTRVSAVRVTTIQGTLIRGITGN
jgi:Gly-Xaa carboxypeptidase